MVYKWYILPVGGLYATYHLLGEPETTIEHWVDFYGKCRGMYQSHGCNEYYFQTFRFRQGARFGFVAFWNHECLGFVGYIFILDYIRGRMCGNLYIWICICTHKYIYIYGEEWVVTLTEVE